MAEKMLLDVWILARLVGAAMDEAVAPAGLAAREFVLYALLQRAGPMTPTELARLSGVPATTISKMVRRMADRGHVVELDHPEDARSRLLQLNAAGATVLADAADGYTKLADEASAALGDDVGQIEWSLQRLRTVLAELSGQEVESAASRPENATAHTLRYSGRSLTSAEEARAREFVDFLRRHG